VTENKDGLLRRLARGPLPYVLIALAVMWLLAGRLMSSQKTNPLPLTGSGTSFEGLIGQGQVQTATFNEGKQVVTGTLKNGDDYVVAYGSDPNIEQQLVNELKAKGVEVHITPSTGFDWVSVFFTAVLPVLLIAGVLIFMMNQMQGGGRGVMAFGKSKHKSIPKDQPKTTFADVAGVDEAIEELEEVKEYLENPAKFQAMGAKIPRGVLLFGPPGTGKTLLARAVAGEAGVPFYTISGSDFVEMFVGVGAARVRDLFDQAKQNAPSIVFIDEIDAVGRHRGAGLGGGHDEREQTLNQLLVEMDGFDQRSTVILMAATNRPDILDPALLRPGRFDRQVVIDRPDLEGRKAILRVHAKGKPLAAEVNLDIIAKRTPGFTGADLANVINEGALLAARRGEQHVSMSELEEAIDRVMAGPERKTRVMSERERRMVAYHEAGHALVGHVLPNTDAVHKISIIPRGRALGYTQTLPEQDKFLMTRDELRDELAMLLGGRVAEQLVVGDSTTGAQNDIERATKIARQMVTEYGMSETLGPQTLGQKQGEVFLGRDFGTTQDYSDQVAFEIDLEVRKLIDEAHDRALGVLQANEAKLHQMASVLMERETIEKEELAAVLADIEKEPLPNGGGSGVVVQRRSSDVAPGETRPAPQVSVQPPSDPPADAIR
jgi:cell division protease FtsH